MQIYKKIISRTGKNPCINIDGTNTEKVWRFARKVMLLQTDGMGRNVNRLIARHLVSPGRITIAIPPSLSVAEKDCLSDAQPP